MRRVRVKPPSFPDAASDLPIGVEAGRLWQVLCGDRAHWRVGIYSPAEISLKRIVELERHDCPELFLLVSGRVTLVLADGADLRELALEPMRPVLVTLPHSGFCPDGAHEGSAVVVERDTFTTEYRSVAQWLNAGSL